MSWSAPEDWSRWDPDKLMVCPYDEAHMIKAKRFQYHLLKCRENHPEKDFVNCPFNAKHVMLRHELRQHVSRCPDRSVIEHYNYKGSEKDEDGFYFKGNTSVPSYHRTEELQEPSESWDNNDVEGNHQQSHHNNVETSLRHQGSSQMSSMVTDTLSLSPEDRDRFKQQMRREAAQRSANSGTQLPSRMCSTSQGYNTNVDIHGQQYSPRTNPVFRHCVEQGAISSLSQQQVGCAQTAPVLRAQARQQVGSVQTAPVSRVQAHQQVGSVHTAPVSRAHAQQQVGSVQTAPVSRAQAHQQVGSVQTAPVSRAQAHQQVGSLHTAPVSRAQAHQQVGSLHTAPVSRAHAQQQVGSLQTAPVSRAQAHQQVGSLHTAPVSRAHAQQQAHYEYDSNLAQSGSIANDVPQPRNRIFQHCLEKIHESQQAREPQTVFEQYNTQLIHGDRKFVKHRGADETVSSHHTSKTQPLSPTDANPEFRSGVIESEMENRFKLIARGTSGVAAVSNVCGQPTSPTSAGVNSPQLAGVGRARLHAEARKNNFGGICFSPPKATEMPTTRTPPVGRGRGMLNFMYSS